ncbi:MAG: hypothetical protein U0176_03750 [Bacteroidia bacterium]
MRGNGRVNVDINNMVDKERVLLSWESALLDSLARQIRLQEGMKIADYEDDVDSEGKRDDLVAEGIVERNETGIEVLAEWRWLCRIDFRSLRNASERGEG